MQHPQYREQDPFPEPVETIAIKHLTYQLSTKLRVACVLPSLFGMVIEQLLVLMGALHYSISRCVV